MVDGGVGYWPYGTRGECCCVVGGAVGRTGALCSWCMSCVKVALSSMLEVWVKVTLSMLGVDRIDVGFVAIDVVVVVARSG